jgi:hypothetical protein
MAAGVAKVGSVRGTEAGLLEGRDFEEPSLWAVVAVVELIGGAS